MSVHYDWSHTAVRHCAMADRRRHRRTVRCVHMGIEDILIIVGHAHTIHDCASEGFVSCPQHAVLVHCLKISRSGSDGRGDAAVQTHTAVHTAAVAVVHVRKIDRRWHITVVLCVNRTGGGVVRNVVLPGDYPYG